MAMCVAETACAPSLWRASTRASQGGAKPSSEVMMVTGRSANFGARPAKFQAAALTVDLVRKALGGACRRVGPYPLRRVSPRSTLVTRGRFSMGAARTE